MYDLVGDKFYAPATADNFVITNNTITAATASPESPIKITSVGERTKNLFDIPDIISSTRDTTIDCYITSNIILSCQEYPTSIRNTNDVETSV